MMDTLRNNTKPIFFITILAFVVGFIFLDLGRGSVSCTQNRGPVENAIAVVNGEVISAELFERQSAAAFEAATGGQSGDDRLRLELGNKTYHQLVEDALLRQEAARRGLAVTRKEVLEGLYEDPPQEIVQSQIFSANGQFDLERYRRALDNPDIRERLVAAQMAQRPIDKLQYEVSASARASFPEVGEILTSRRQNATVSYVRISPSLFGPSSAELGEGDVRQHYEANLAKYTPKETAVLTFAYLPRQATAEDTLATRDVMESLYYELEAGEDFGVLMDHSDAPNTMRGGPQGTFLTKQSPEMTFELGAVLDTLREGQFSAPFTDVFGYHIVRIDSMKVVNDAKSWRLQDILVRVVPSGATSADLAARMQRFRERVRDGGDFAAASDTTALAITTTDPIDLSTPALFVPGVPVFKELSTFIREAEVGAVSEVYEGPAGFYVWKLDSRGPGKPTDLAKIEPQVRADAARSRGKDEAMRRAQEIADRTRAGAKLEDVVAGQSQLRVETGKKFVRYGSIPGIGKDAAIMGTVFAMPVGAVEGPLENQSGDLFVIRLDERDPEIAPDPTADKPMLDNLVSMKQTEILSSLLEELRKAGNVRDLRPVRVGSL